MASSSQNSIKEMLFRIGQVVCACILEASTLVGISIVTVAAWVTAIKLKWNFQAMGVSLTGAALPFLQSFDSYLYTVNLDTPTFVGRLIVAITICIVSLSSVGLSLLSTGPRDPISAASPKSVALSWLIGNKGKVKDISPMQQCFTGILAILSFMRAIEYFIVLMGRLNISPPTAIANMLSPLTPRSADQDRSQTQTDSDNND